MKVIGIDIALRNTGIALVNLDTDSLTFQIEGLKLIETEVAKTGKVVRKNSEDLERCRVISAELEPFYEIASMIFVEMPVGSQSARAMASYGMSIGILSNCNVPMIQLTPYEVKLAAVGDKSATKREMINWATAKYPGDHWLTTKSGEYLNKNEHLADAVAAIEAGLKTDDFKGVLNLAKWMNR